MTRYLAGKVMPGVRVAVTGIYSIFHGKSTVSYLLRNADGLCLTLYLKQKTAGTVGIRAPYLRIVGMQADADGGRNRIFTPEEEEQYSAMARRPNLYEEFANSIAPQIFGSPG
jgi:DNA replication licensing factor MCM5